MSAIMFLIMLFGLGALAIYLLAAVSPIELKEPIVANYKHSWLVTTKAGDKVRIVAILEYQFEEIGEPYYFVQSKKTGASYHLKESEIKPKEKK